MHLPTRQRVRNLQGYRVVRTVLAYLLVASSVALATTAQAGDLVYSPINPSFGGNPLNSSHLLGIASAQREATASDFEEPIDGDLGTPGTGTGGNTEADLFVRQLQGRLYSALAGQVTEAIFGENPQDAGEVKFGDTTVSFERTLDSIRLVIADAATGTLTEIVVPQLVSGSGF